MEGIARERAEVSGQLTVLGEVRVHVAGRPVDSGPARQRCVLAALAVDLNHVVPVERLIRRVWGDEPPHTARTTLSTYVSRLRKVLPPGVELANRSGGYVVQADPAAVDLHRFRRLTALARGGADERAVRVLREALDLWRGEALTGIPGDWAAGYRELLRQERLAVEGDLTDALLRLGRAEELLPALAARTTEHPLDERLAAQYMLALHLAGRSADALDHYRRTRALLVEELGTEPGERLRRRHQEVLSADAPAERPKPPNTLPRDLDDFTGRDAELRRLLAGGHVTVVDGMAGVGKTALALRMAHRVAARYPDGRLFLDLHGHSPGQAPVAAVDALESLLRQAGVAGDAIPRGVDDRAALWRAWTADRRVLVVLDNAADAAQVRPLLPGGGGCRVVVTSRDRLTGLEGVDRLSLDVLPLDQSVALVERVLGKPVDEELPAAREAARMCGFLPLALRIAATRARSRPSWTIAHLAERLGDEHGRLAELRAGDRGVEAAFSLSYRQLDAAQRRMFRGLGAAPVAEFDRGTAAAVAAVPAAEAEVLLEGLHDANLLLEPTPGRFRFHDLLRHHARALATREDSAEDRDAAAARLCDFLLHTAARAADALEPSRVRFPIAVARFDLPAFPTSAEAIAWLELEHRNLVAAVGVAFARGWWTRCWQLAQTLWRFFFVRGHLQDWVTTHHQALTAAGHDDNPAAEAEILKNLGLAHWRSGDFDAALDHHYRALVLDIRTADAHGEAKTHNHLGLIHSRMGNHDDAVRHQKSAVACYRRAGDRTGLARAYLGLGNAHYHAGEAALSVQWYTFATALCTQEEDHWGLALALVGHGFALGSHGRPLLSQALDLSAVIGDRWSECLALCGIGRCDHLDGDPERAADTLRRAVTLARTTGDRWGLRLALSTLGAVLTDLSLDDEALAAHTEALALARELHNPDLVAETTAALARTASW
ncbi:Regulatory protein AfsR [Actinosynnema sp. ALI-1.44]